MGGPLRVVVLAALVLALVLAGCVSKKEDDAQNVLRSWSRESPTDTQSTVSFTVPKDADQFRFTVSTKPPKDDGGNDPYGGWDQMCAWDPSACANDDEPDTAGRITVTLWDPANNEFDRVQLGYDSRDTLVVPEPRTGRWTAKITYQGYEGPVTLTASEPAATTSGFGDNFWDIFGVVLTLGAAGGGWYLYRRRTRFLTRELGRIDHTFSALSDDVDECRANLLDMKRHLGDLLARRKIEESQYLILEKRIEQYLHDLDTPGNRHAHAAAGSRFDPVGEAEA